MFSNYQPPSGGNCQQGKGFYKNCFRLTQLIAMFISVWLAAAGIGRKRGNFILITMPRKVPEIQFIYQPINFQFTFWKTPVTHLTLTMGKSSPTGTASTSWWWPCPPLATETSTAWPPLDVPSRQEKRVVDQISTILLFSGAFPHCWSRSLCVGHPRDHWAAWTAKQVWRSLQEWKRVRDNLILMRTGPNFKFASGVT